MEHVLSDEILRLTTAIKKQETTNISQVSLTELQQDVELLKALAPKREEKILAKLKKIEILEAKVR